MSDFLSQRMRNSHAHNLPFLPSHCWILEREGRKRVTAKQVLYRETQGCYLTTAAVILRKDKGSSGCP
jgi:hypothetical protein